MSLTDKVVEHAAKFMGQRFRTKEEIQKELRKGKKRAPSIDKLTSALEARGYPVTTEEVGGTTFFTTPSRPRTITTPANVYFLSEVAYDSFQFEQEESQTAYQNLLKYIGSDPDIAGIVLDGVHTRLDRPEWLATELTYWHMDEEEANKATQDVKNYEQLEHMFEKQMDLLDHRLAEMRKAIPKDTKIVLNINTDDLGYTVSAKLNELLIQKAAEREDKIQKLKTRAGTIKSEWKKHLDRKSKATGKNAEKAAVHADRSAKNRQAVEEQIDEMMREQRLFREKKIRPTHQFVSKELVDYITLRYAELCQKHSVELMSVSGILEFDGMKIEYAHSRHDTPGVIKGRAKKLLTSLHGKLDVYEAKGIDAIVESGHHGIGFKQAQKIKNTDEEMNFQNQGRYDPQGGSKMITILLAMPFENQNVLKDIMKGKYPGRFAMSTPRATRNHASKDRFKNGGVAGLTFLRRTEEGVFGIGEIEYDAFASGRILKEPAVLHAIDVTSDEHLGSPEEDRTAQLGAQVMHRERTQKTRSLRGKKLLTSGYMSGGDTAEANKQPRWPDSYFKRFSPEKLRERERERLKVDIRTADIDTIVKIHLERVSDGMQGSVEMMPDILDQVDAFYNGFFIATIDASKLLHAHTSVTGNHADGPLNKTGFREADFFRRRYADLSIQVGEPGLSEEEQARRRVWLGGYSVARILSIPNYGASVEGEPLFGPIRVILQHDPKGSFTKGLANVGKSGNADLTLSGHTHETWIHAVKRDENQIRFSYRLATLQGVSPTELAYAGLPRTQGANSWIMPMAGVFYEETIPAQLLRDRGHEQVELDVKRALIGK